MLTFSVGGMTDVLLAVPPADFVLHNCLFLIAHLHNVIIGGDLTGDPWGGRTLEWATSCPLAEYNFAFNPFVTALTVAVLAVVQIVVHMACFLHMTSKAEEGRTMLAMIFTVVVVVIMLSGAIRVMYHLTANMMPQMSRDMKTAR